MDLIIKKIERKGRGVFAGKHSLNGGTIEACPVIVLSEKDTEAINPTQLYSYYFSWGENSKLSALALGFGSLYNHSYTPNAMYAKDYAKGIVLFTAIKDIREGEEITVNYNGDPKDQKPLWFTVFE